MSVSTNLVRSPNESIGCDKCNRGHAKFDLAPGAIAIFRCSLVHFGEITIGTHPPQKALKAGAPHVGYLPKRTGDPPPSAILVHRSQAKYSVVDNSVGQQCVHIKYAEREEEQV